MKRGSLIAAGLSLGVVALVTAARAHAKARVVCARVDDEVELPLDAVPYETQVEWVKTYGMPVETKSVSMRVLGVSGDTLDGMVLSFNAPRDFHVLRGNAPVLRGFPCSAVTSVQRPDVTRPGPQHVLDAATGILFTQVATITPPAPAPPILPRNTAFLTGEESSSPERAAIEKEVRAAFARMNAYYTSEWYPRFIGQSRPDIPNTLANGSQYRSFEHQANIVRNVLTELGVTRASSDAQVRSALLQSLTTRSVPGFSRHHWGTEIDVVDATATRWQPGGPYWQLVPFMQNEAPKFGFYNSFREGSFPDPTRPHYNSEPWHLSYYPIAGPLRERWLSEVDVPALLERVAAALSGAADINVLRRVLPTLDLPSYHQNVVPPPPSPLAAEQIYRPSYVRI